MNKNNRHTEATKKIMSEISRLRWADPIYRKKYTESHIGKKHRTETRKKISRAQTGPRNANWKGGVKILDGYRFIYIPELKSLQKDFPYIAEHRLVMEKILGRPLLPIEEVHHINKKKTDNRPKNLMVFSSGSAHTRYERGFSVKPNEIVFDGSKSRLKPFSVHFPESRIEHNGGST